MTSGSVSTTTSGSFGDDDGTVTCPLFTAIRSGLPSTRTSYRRCGPRAFSDRNAPRSASASESVLT